MEQLPCLTENGKRPSEESDGGPRKEMRMGQAPHVSSQNNLEDASGMAALLSMAKSEGDADRSATQNGNGSRRTASYKGVPTNVLSQNTSTFSARLENEGGAEPPTGMVVMRGGPNGGMVPQYGMPMNMPMMIPGSHPFNIMTVVPSPALPVHSAEALLAAQQDAIQTYRPTVIPNARQLNHGFVQLIPAGVPGVLPNAEQLQQSLDVRTRVKCAGSVSAREGGLSQKLWKKYGEKIVQPGRNKQGTGAANYDAKQWLVKRSYFRCYNKACPARMTADIVIEGGKELSPVGSGTHTHAFEICGGNLETPNTGQNEKSTGKASGSEDQPKLVKLELE